MSGTIIDDAAIRELRSLEADNPGFLADILRQFLEDDVPNRLQAIDAAFDAGDLAQVGREAHGLKNSCSVVGAIRARELCHRMESKGIDAGVASEIYGELLQALEEASGALRDLLPDAATGTSSPK